VRIRWAMLAGAVVLAASAAAEDTRTLDSELEKLSYAFGMEAGANLRKYALQVDPDLLLRGLKDALSGDRTLLTEMEMRALIADLRGRLTKPPNDADTPRTTQELAEKNRAAGQAFLAANKVRMGIITLASGVQYEILREGEGARPTIDDTVAAHYRGTLIDGTQFDSSYERKRPATLHIQQTIAGWREALQLMPVGSKWRVFIPSDLAYGARSAGDVIGANSTLIFEVELLSIAGARQAQNVASDVVDIQFYFKVDPRLTRGLYMGDRWITPSTYVGAGGQNTVSARARCVDRGGRPIEVSPTWIASDPEMVAVSPGEGNEVQILVKRAGKSSLLVTSQGVTEELDITAMQKGEAIGIEIAQKSTTGTGGVVSNSVTHGVSTP
jgi:FKBP-type peptidyl-prolyl cis-trans isomerase FklB